MPTLADDRFVVVGGASQIGSHIAQQLLDAGAREVRLLDNLSLGSATWLRPVLADPRCTLTRGDVMRLSDLCDVMDGADGVFAVAGLMASSIDADPWTGLDVNVRGVQNTLEACRMRGVKKIVFSSSTGVYGGTEGTLTDEHAPLRWEPLTPAMTLYCASKVIGEGLARLYRERHGLEYVALRYSAVYGERQHGRALVGGHIAQTCERVRRGEPALMDGDGAQVHDYVYAGDVARANLLAMSSDVSGEAINVCSGVPTSQRRIVELVAAACGTEVSVESRPRAGGGRMPVVTDHAYDRDKAERLLGWAPQVSIEDGVARLLRWIDQRPA